MEDAPSMPNIVREGGKVRDEARRLDSEDEPPLTAWLEYYDTESGVLLPPAVVEAARKEGIDTARNWKPKAMWKDAPRQKAIDL